ncbi:hypothetical protein FJ651_07380 [Paucihalobacter ruber]|uniref:Uncharacterized protein n=1 Tax=Paucihalobacter ruber TaxID=2567861 RepID=A0A506PJK3_9FLAO|nr:hypothetical protein [Paucihalobacter ruber]TPV33971.1 hypothetical protein FJ651_07380 [Paucihalobacter ruber]
MKSKKLILVVTIIAAISFNSCVDAIKEFNNWGATEDIEELPGKYHFLEKEGIKVFLPEIFERTSMAEYLELVKTMGTKDEYAFEVNQFKSRSRMDGNFYIYFDKDSGSTYSIYTRPYLQLYQEEAANLLAVIRANQDEAAKGLPRKFTKITAKFDDSRGPQIFKAVYKIENTKKKTEVFQHSYIVSSNDHTVFINLTTPFQDVNFDVFLQKMVM